MQQRRDRGEILVAITGPVRVDRALSSLCLPLATITMECACCHFWHKAKCPLMKCSRCKKAFYCSKACHQKGICLDRFICEGFVAFFALRQDWKQDKQICVSQNQILLSLRLPRPLLFSSTSSSSARAVSDAKETSSSSVMASPPGLDSVTLSPISSAQSIPQPRCRRYISACPKKCVKPVANFIVSMMT